MGIWRGEDRTIEVFAARFEQDGSQYLFRRNLRAAPVRVTREERNEQIIRFKKSIRYLIFGVVASTVAMIFVLVALGSDPDSRAGSVEMWGLFALLGAAFLLIWFHLWNAPARAFENRMPAGSERTREQAQRIALGKLSWSQLAIAPFVCLVILIPRRHEGFSGTGFDIKLGFVGLLLLLAIVQAIRKWRSEHADQ